MMTNHKVLRRIGTFAAFVMVASMAATTAYAETFSLSGNARLQIGGGLPLPIQFAAPPDGGILPILGAEVEQTAVPDTCGVSGTDPCPDSISMAAGQLTYDSAPVKIPLFGSNPTLFQVQTDIAISMPNATATLAAGGRAGAQNVQYCPGQGAATGPSWNPGCLLPSQGTINGIVRYSGTITQFGGKAPSNITGTADIALAAGVSPPACSPCTVIFALANPAGQAGYGATWGFIGGSLGSAPNPGLANVSAIGAGPGAGLITNVISNIPAPGLTNNAITHGAPWTTGSVQVSAPLAAGGAELFTIAGSDNRTANGAGSISLVGGSISNRTVTGLNANRGWMNLVLTKQLNTPSMALPGMMTLVGLIGLAGGYAVRRLSSKS